MVVQIHTIPRSWSMKIAVVGGYGVGMTMRVTDAPLAGETVTGGELSISHGGKGSNQAVAASRLGAEVALLTAVGADPAADAARAFWESEGIVAGRVVVSDRPTMTGFIVVDASGENRISIAPGALEELSATDAESFRDDIRTAAMLIVSLEIPMEAALAALRIAREEGTRTLLNPAPVSMLPGEVWPLVDILTPNHSEAATLLGRRQERLDDPAEAARELQGKFGGIVVLTAGSHGVYVNDGANDFCMPAVAVDRVLDTTGAGDAFTAALGVALAEGMPLLTAVQLATAAGAHAVTIADVIPSLPTRAQLERFMTTTPTMRDRIPRE
jgi:Sugar kinases, ribokinase family